MNRRTVIFLCIVLTLYCGGCKDIQQVDTDIKETINIETITTSQQEIVIDEDVTDVAET